MTTDLATLAPHESYTALDNDSIGDGTGLYIANIGSFTLPSVPTPLLFTNVLHVPAMSKNLISISALCVDNPVMSYFLTLSFRCRIVTRGSLWFAGSVEMVSTTGQHSSPFDLQP